MSHDIDHLRARAIWTGTAKPDSPAEQQAASLHVAACQICSDILSETIEEFVPQEPDHAKLKED
jgi:hypothetical protein